MAIVDSSVSTFLWAEWEVVGTLQPLDAILFPFMTHAFVLAGQLGLILVGVMHWSGPLKHERSL